MKITEGTFGPSTRTARPSVAGGSAGPRGGAPGNSERLLGAFKYRAYLVVLLIGIASAVFSWWLSRATHRERPINDLTDPVLAVLCVGLVAILPCAGNGPPDSWSVSGMRANPGDFS